MSTSYYKNTDNILTECAKCLGEVVIYWESCLDRHPMIRYFVDDLTLGHGDLGLAELRCLSCGAVDEQTGYKVKYFCGSTRNPELEKTK